MEICSDCRFQRYGECRRYAPRPVLGPRLKDPEATTAATWPQVKAYVDGCGEFEAIPPAPPPADRYTGPWPCTECGSPTGQLRNDTIDEDCKVCGAASEIPF